MEIELKTKRSRYFIKSFLLRNGSATTAEIRNYMNKNTRDGILPNALNVILHVDPDIKNIGKEKIIGNRAHGKYPIIVWELSELDPKKWSQIPSSPRRVK